MTQRHHTSLLLVALQLAKIVQHTRRVALRLLPRGRPRRAAAGVGLLDGCLELLDVSGQRVHELGTVRHSEAHSGAQHRVAVRQRQESVARKDRRGDGKPGEGGKPGRGREEQTDARAPEGGAGSRRPWESSSTVKSRLPAAFQFNTDSC